MIWISETKNGTRDKEVYIGLNDMKESNDKNGV